MKTAKNDYGIRGSDDYDIRGSESSTVTPSARDGGCPYKT